MSRIRVVRLHAACPSCGVPQSLAAAHRELGGDCTAVLHECGRCWLRRAQALNEARANLRRQGDLAGAGSRLTWHGELLGDARELDGLTGALQSELLRRDIPAEPAARLSLPAPAAAPAEARTEA